MPVCSEPYHQAYAWSEEVGRGPSKQRRIFEDLCCVSITHWKEITETDHATHNRGTLWTSNSGNDASQAHGLQRVFLRASSLQSPKGVKTVSSNSDEAILSPSQDTVINEGWVLSILKKYDFSLHQIVRTCAAELHGVYQNADERIM